MTDSKQDAVRGGGYDPVGGKVDCTCCFVRRKKKRGKNENWSVYCFSVYHGMVSFFLVFLSCSRRHRLFSVKMLYHRKSMSMILLHMNSFTRTILVEVL